MEGFSLKCPTPWYRRSAPIYFLYHTTLWHIKVSLRYFAASTRPGPFRFFTCLNLRLPPASAERRLIRCSNVTVFRWLIEAHIKTEKPSIGKSQFLNLTLENLYAQALSQQQQLYWPWFYYPNLRHKKSDLALHSFHRELTWLKWF